MQKDFVESILKEYDDKHTLYNLFTTQIKNLIEELLNENHIRVHSITSRLKTRESLRRKISREDCTYQKLSDISDIAGVRIITYFEDEVDIIAKIIEKEFKIDVKESVDKRQMLDPDRFGYVSLHYVANLLDSRLQLTEYRRFLDLRVEIQIRSILQHAWAEIEHDLGYKIEISVPKVIKRRFSRLAGLLELADSEFLNIRDNLQKYKDGVIEQISNEPASVLIDKISLWEFVKSSKLIYELDHKIASFTNAKIIEHDAQIGSHVRELRSIELKTIADLESSLKKFSKLIIDFAENWLKGSKTKKFNKGISLFYLCYVILGCKGIFEKTLGYLHGNNIGYTHDRDMCARQVISLCSKLK